MTHHRPGRLRARFRGYGPTRSWHQSNRDTRSDGHHSRRNQCADPAPHRRVPAGRFRLRLSIGPYTRHHRPAVLDDIARNTMNPKLVAIIEHYAQTHGLNLPPHQIVSDMVASGPSGVEQLLGLMGVTVNAGDPSDNLQAQLGQSQREAGLNYATTQFPATEQSSTSNLAGVGSKDPMSEFTQLMQGATGIGQGLTSSMTGLLQPFTQIAQQIPQQGMQAMQAVMGAAKGAGGGAAAAGAIPEELLGAGGGLAGGAAGELGGAAGGAGAGLASTIPASQLGPPPTPSAGTVP